MNPVNNLIRTVHDIQKCVSLSNIFIKTSHLIGATFRVNVLERRTLRMLYHEVDSDVTVTVYF